MWEEGRIPFHFLQLMRERGPVRIVLMADDPDRRRHILNQELET